MIKDDKYVWCVKNIRAVREKPAKYELYVRDEIIYIGSTGNLRERFMGYWNSGFADDPCKKATYGYKREYVSSEAEALNRERANLLEYQRKNGKLPRCNDRIP